MSKIIDVITHKKLNNLWFYTMFFIVVLIIFFPYLPSNNLTQLLEYVIYLSPRWGLLLLTIPIFLFWNGLTKIRRFCFIFFVGYLIYFQDVNLNLPSSSQESADSVKLVSLNMGGGSDSKYLKAIIKREDPDLFLFQETYLPNINRIFEQPWQLQCNSGLCIASKYPFKKMNEYSRRIFSGWGNFAVSYELDINGTSLPLMNVHLETPRHILSNLMARSVNWREVSLFRENKSLEASLLSSWASSQPFFVMSGDFNMTTNESLYRDYFSSFQNALDTAGFGFNYTKYTAWHGVRIDHVLASHVINIQQAEVMPSLGGDHRAVVTTIKLP